MTRTLGDGRARQQDTVAAIAAYRRAIQLDSRLSAAHVRLGHVLQDAGQPKEAIAAYESAIDAYSKLITDQTTNATLLSKRAAAYLSIEQWELARADWLRAIKRQPDLLNQAFNAFRNAEQWSIAAVFGQQLVDKAPEDSIQWIYVAPMVVLSGDEELYAKFCLSILKTPATTPESADRAIKICLLRSGVVDISNLPGETLATALDNETAPAYFRPWEWSTRALLAYRSGDAKSAVNYVAKSEANQPQDFTQTMNEAILAMAHCKLNHPDESRTALEKASELITRLNKDTSKKGQPDLLIAEILYREAQAMINDKDNSADDPSSPLENSATMPAQEPTKANTEEPENGEGN